ncbi:HyaD/HybD family hydrogenase maturation endopeptidase [Corynebacterium felinum]|uniref:Hydrogenase maturation protease n=1 Tax=Corynebacterium felinum TaxID=131318 RepID=A0ABU2BAX0_9CORY|nr:HyaD/HybD family hydrogenase maturation endopeptidase [Corynebacterium felinum]MDF5820242.1 HyaD/HybD family hydrogenase maturation endopeptidase [Corynebacterium felinum]MDR7354883.1 hydrogenase maturation protease [Corynebacterium felinum]WJY94243.1 Hydrogenase 2 maturation protease [Corynebacterium felinum]
MNTPYSDTTNENRPVTFHVIGIGNTIMGDDGIGLAMLEQLRHTGPKEGSYTNSGRTIQLSYIDGGTSGMELLPDIEDADYLLVLDALGGPGAPGQVHNFVGDQLPRLLKAKLSPHQVGLLDLLAAVRLLGSEPQAVAAVGIVAQDLQLHVGLSECASQALPEAVECAEELITRWLQHPPS